MSTQDRNIKQSILVAAAVVVVMAGFATLALASNWALRQSANAVPEVTAEEAPKRKCSGCGVVESVRRIAAIGTVLASYEITVRMPGGASRIVTDTVPANWRAGDRMILIAGRH